jgi:hypothetical protein
MAAREITLDTAAFLDSPASQALAEVRREDQRAIVERFLECAYDELGVAPKLLDGEGMHTLVGHLLPAHFRRKDPLAAQALPVVRAYLAFLEQHAVVLQLFEIRQALESTAHEFEHAVATGESVHHHAPKRDKPFVHQAQKTGRNDPCPCGSGRKFKQCCMRL